MTQQIRYQLPDRNLGLDLMRVTEAAALAAGRWAGRGDKEGGDGAAVDAMRDVIASVPMRGVVVIGEGEKDEAPMLYNGEEVGDGSGPAIDIAVDPVDGTTLLANGMPNAIAVMAAADRGSMYDPSAVFYMDKLVCAGAVAGEVDIDAPVEHNVRAVARALGGTPADVTVSVLNRPRHEQLIADVRAAGARIKLFSDGDVAGAIAAASPDTGHRPAAGHRRHAGGDHHRVRDEGDERGDPGPARAATTRRSAARPWTPATTSTGCCTPTTSSPATTRSSWPPGSPTASCCGACATPRRAPRPSRS